MSSDRRHGRRQAGWPEGAGPKAPDDDADLIGVRLGELLEERQLTLTELASRIGITIANLSILKNGHARAVRFATLAAICRELDCQPGDLLTYQAR